MSRRRSARKSSLLVRNAASAPAPRVPAVPAATSSSSSYAATASASSGETSQGVSAVDSLVPSSQRSHASDGPSRICRQQAGTGGAVCKANSGAWRRSAAANGAAPAAPANT
eukprot:5663-Chlamydomonas_euryale.AAC.1